MPNCPNSTYNPVHFIRTSKEMTERVHAYGSKIFLMMSAGFGRVTIPTNLGEFPPVAPSAIPHRWLDKICRPLTKEEIHSIVKSFGDGAYHANWRFWREFTRFTRVICRSVCHFMFNQRTDEAEVHWKRSCSQSGRREKSRCGQDFPVVPRFAKEQ
ncbi:MAG: 2-enoate reductase, partial [Hungatella sp.]